MPLGVLKVLMLLNVVICEPHSLSTLIPQELKPTIVVIFALLVLMFVGLMHHQLQGRL